MYIGDTFGVVYELDPRQAAVTGQAQLPERVTDRVIGDRETGLIFVRCCEGSVYAIHRDEAQQIVATKS